MVQVDVIKNCARMLVVARKKIGLNFQKPVDDK